MLKIAFCDNDHAALEEIRVLLNQYRTERKQEIEDAAFSSPLDLLAEIEKGTRFDILFLDAVMSGETGLDAAAEIRHYDHQIKIIFLTASAAYAVQSYTVGAYSYQLKPIWRESFFSLMDSAISACEVEYADSLILQGRRGVTRVELRQLEYCEVIHRTLFFHLHSGEVLESSGSLNDLCQKLDGYKNFLRPHRSYLVNLDYVQHLSARAITLSGQTEIPVPRGKYQSIKRAFLAYAHQNKQVPV